MIFQKRADYDPAQARAVLGAVDLNKVVQITPEEGRRLTKICCSPAQLWAAQQAGGTWATLFPPEGLQNRFPGWGWWSGTCSCWLLGVAGLPAGAAGAARAGGPRLPAGADRRDGAAGLPGLDLAGRWACRSRAGCWR